MKINPPIAEVSTPLFEREGMGVSLMKKIYKNPEMTVVALNAFSPLAQSVAKYSTGGGEVLTKENENSWGSIWDE